MKPLLEVKNLQKTFVSTQGIIHKKTTQVHAVDDVSFTIAPKGTMAIVGESGCGKSTTAKCINRLLEPTGGDIIFDGVNIAALSPEQMRKKRRDIQMIYQDPYSSLNPRMTVGKLLLEPLKTHTTGTRKEMDAQVEEMIDFIGLSKKQLSRYPHQFSGGPAPAYQHCPGLNSAPKADFGRRTSKRLGCIDTGPNIKPAG